MSSRFSAARPKRAGEAFARAHHGESPASNKKVKFDVRNPSALAPSGQDDDYDDADEQVLAADVIGVPSGATKRGAVNIDGYDSDSDEDNFNARAEARGKAKGKGKRKAAEEVDLAETMDNYNAKPGAGGAAANDAEDDDDDEMDMFGNDDEEGGDADEEAAGRGKAGKRGKEVRFLADNEIEGQEDTSKSGGVVHIDDQDSTDDDDDEVVQLAIEEEGLDEEVGAGGLKKHAPKIDAFNMKAEQEEGGFDESGNYIRNAIDPNAVHDKWLEGVSKKEMKKAAAAHEKREAELKAQRREEDSILTGDLLRDLILRLDRGETALEALARLAKSQTKPKKVPKWKQKKQQRKGSIGEGGMDVDAEKEPEDPKQVKIKEMIAAITEAADRLLRRDYPEVYDWERERLVREYRNETGEPWTEPPADEAEEQQQEAASGPTMWEYRWTDGRDGAPKQGPYDGPTMKAWQDAGYFGEGVEFRPAGEEGGWTRVASFV